MIEALSLSSSGLDRLLRLNNAHAAELSWLTAEALRRLIETGFRATRIGEADAMLVAFDQDADYASPNFRWFQARYPRFVYVDRVVVAPEARGRGLARMLYADLFEAARKAGHRVVGCEVNSAPPNPASDAFHAGLGFQVVGEAALAGGEKAVRYHTLEL
ncbi:MAG: GNAT family N-acetyltransferase [Methylobacterium mesophilicum]|nr:GNAT family N-acetyltransferase [Methylobacterium mesophilicum]